MPKLYQARISDPAIVGQQWNIQSPGGSNNDSIGRITRKFFWESEKLLCDSARDLSQLNRFWMNRFVQPIGRAWCEFECTRFYQDRQFPKASDTQKRALGGIIKRRDNFGREPRQTRYPPDPYVRITE